MNQRREPRIDVDWQVRAASLSGVCNGRTVNVSLCGILFTSESQLAQGELVVLRVRLSACTTVECVAEVVRNFISDAGELYGMDFRYISADDVLKLGHALSLVKKAA